MNRRDFLRIMTLSLAGLPITGCWGQTEIEDLGFVIALGVDIGSSPGLYRVTYQMGIPEKKGEGGSISNQTFSVEGRSMRETMEKTFSISGKRPFIGTIRVLLFGEAVAQAGLNSVFDFFQRYYELRRTTYLLLTRGKAETILQVKDPIHKLPALTILAIMEQSKLTSTFPVIRLGHFLTLLATASTAPVVPLINKTSPTENEKITISGAGVFCGDRLADYLSDRETRGYVWLRNEVEVQYITVHWKDDVNSFASGRAVNSSTSWKLVQEDGSKGINYEIKSKFYLDEISGVNEEKTPAEWLAFAKAQVMPAFEQEVREECLAVCRKSKELSLDILGIGRHIEEKNPALWKQVKDDWQQILKEFPVEIEVHLKPENAGASFNPPTNPPGTRKE
ncbi:MAG: Ger(x)C family spore germination protein [Desulfitobacteriaceae bacterium]